MIKNTVTNDIHTSNKKIIKKFRSELANFTEKGVRNALHELLLPDTDIHMPFPFGDLVGPNDLFDICLLYTSPSPRDATLSRMPSSA